MITNVSSSVIFISDISGYSKFVNDIEILHGQEIAAELLEEIINADELDLEISEIEGDAVLFYKFGEPISLDEIYLQSVKTLQRFTKRKAEVQEKRICQCNACSSVKNLSLKFILHFDEVEIIKIKQFNKLFGKGVIIAHRLLKNSIEEKEYLLFTKNYPNVFENLQLSLNSLISKYEGFEEIECSYVKINIPN